MQITITIEATPENIEKLKLFCSEEKTQKIAVKKTKIAEVKETPKENTAPVAEIKDAKKESEKLTKSDVRTVALKLSKAGKSDALKKIFAKFGTEKLSGISEDKYPELMRELVEAND